MSGRSTSDDAVGSLAEETAKLMHALQEALGSAGDGAGGDAAEHLGALLGSLSGPECQICPLCRLLATLRRTRPEVFEHLSDAVRSLLAAAREVVVTPDHGPPPGAAEPERQGVQRIDVS